MSEEPPDLTASSARIPPALERVVRRFLEKQPDNRFQSGNDLAFAIEAAGDKGSPAPDGRHRDTSMVWRQWRLVFGIAILLQVAVGVG